MRKILFILALVFVCSICEAQLVTGDLKITNAPVNTSTITVNGRVFTWTNGTPIGSFAILITNTLAGDATNLYNVAGLVLPNIGVSLTQTNGTNIIFSGNQMAESISTAWASLVLTTNANVGATNVIVPFSVMAANSRTNIASQLTLDVPANSTNAVDQNSKFASQLAGLAKSNNLSGILVATNITNLIGGRLTNVVIYNGSNFGSPFRSPGGGVGSEQFGLGASANATAALALGDGATANDSQSTAIGNGAISTGTGSLAVGFNATTVFNNDTALGANAAAQGGASIAIGSFSESDRTNGIAIGASAIATQSNSVAIGPSANSSFTNSTAIGQNSATTATNQVALGTSTGTVLVPGSFYVTGGALITGAVTNFQAAGTNAINAVLTGPRFVNTLLANGQNQDVVLGTNLTTQFSGLTAAFTTAGFVGGIADRYAFALNSTVNNWTIENDSGFESTPANRIFTGTGASVVLSSNSWALFNYDASVTHWRLVFASGTPSTGGSGNFSGTFAGDGGSLTNLNYRAGFQAIGNLATSQAVTFTTPFLPAVGTNYSVSISSDSTLASAVGFSATSKTTNGFTITLSAGVAGGIGVDYSAMPYR